jgi:hypothetical protein
MSLRSTRLLTCVGLPTLAAIAALVLFELFASMLTRGSGSGSGEFLGVLLPPRQVIPAERRSSVAMDEPFGELVVQGVQITRGDLWGIMREDPNLGYVPTENSRSLNGWWRSNDLGARHDHDIGSGQAAEPGASRVLVFGESFNGYGMAQSLLRYQSVSDRTHHDAVVFVFLPTANLWRDINTIRSLAEPWDSFAVLPRYLPVTMGVELIRSPYSNVAEVFRANQKGLSSDLRSHLQRYDRFYVRELFEPTALSAHFVTGKLVAAYLGKRSVQRIRSESFYEADSEAWRTVRGIFAETAAQAQSGGIRFAVVVMPTHDDVETAIRYPEFDEHWGRMVERLRDEGLVTIDLLPDLAQVSSSLDYGYDGSHYGPVGSSHIASAVGKKLSSWMQE